jgi:hypothetical protein
MFLAWLAHEVLERVRANEARFVLAQLRVLRDIRVSDKTLEFTSFPTSTTWSGAMLSRGEHWFASLYPNHEHYHVRIPIEAGRVFRREAGQGSGLKPATIPI